MQHRWRQQRPLAVLALVAVVAAFAPSHASWGASPLSDAQTPLDRVLPHAVLDDISVPDEPVRVAIRPKLDWRPGLAEAAERKSAVNDSAPPALPEKLRPEPVPDAQGPKLTAPIASKTVADKSAPAKKAEPEAKTAAEPKTLPPTIKSSAKAIHTAEPLTTTTPRKAETDTPERKPVAKAPPEPLTRGLRNLRYRLRTVLSHYYRQPLNNVEHDPWEVMHSMLSFELHSRVQDRNNRNKPLTAVGHLCFNRPCKGQRLMRLNADGQLDAPIGVGLQGHKGQFLAMLAQCNVSPDYPIRVSGKEFTIHDLIAAEQKTCYAGEELTFKLIGLGHYLDSDAQWLNDRGESWSIPKLIAEERKQPIRGAACGGTHRLAGLGLAVRRRGARGEPIDGEYEEAARFVEQYHNYAWRLQNRDGSMSTEWFRGPGDEEDLERRIRTSGHTVEWLVYSVPDSELRSSRLVRAVNYLTNLLAHNSDKDWHLGSLGHAVHALVLYDKRVFQPHDDEEALQLAAVDPSSSYFRGYRIYRNVLRRTPPESSGFLGLFGNTRTSRRR